MGDSCGGRKRGDRRSDVGNLKSVDGWRRQLENGTNIGMSKQATTDTQALGLHVATGLLSVLRLLVLLTLILHL